MKHERNFEPMRREEEEPYDEPYPAWVQVIVWGGITAFCGACYVGAFHLLMWALS